ncbi:MAG: hypothetical protein E7443_02320 [Ruminococcaceae bacterium]|nr:hypothetical protein [Oscillospiraceae bacterium]
MLTVFNRKELLPVFSHQRLYAVQAALDDAGIPYHTTAATPLGRLGGRGRENVFQNADAAHDYKIYVRKDDYDRAVQAIQPVLRNE